MSRVTSGRGSWVVVARGNRRVSPAAGGGAVGGLDQDFVSVALEPGFGFGVAWADSIDFEPEAPGVIEVPEVGEFVEDDVIHDEAGALEEPPVEGDRAVA